MTRPRRLLQLVALVLALSGSAALAHGCWLPAKAWLAQVLLQRAWERVEAGEAEAKPWPWADTSPVARLRMPRLHVDTIVLRGDSGRTLAFGPGWTESSALPGERGLSVVSAHRDTHFAFLREARVGDEVAIERDGRVTAYRIDALRVVDARRERIDTSVDGDTLVLVTCWPFDALDARGPLRYVALAHPLAAGEGV